MNMKDTNLTLAGRMAFAAALFVFAFAGQTFAGERLTITAGSPGGGYFKAAAAYAEFIKKDIPGTDVTVIPGGGWANIERLQPGLKLADIAVVENATATMASQGTGPKGKKYDFRMLAAVRGPSVSQAAVVESLGVKSFEEIVKNKTPIRIVMFERFQLSATLSLELLKGYGLTENKVKSWGGKFIFTSAGEAIRMIMDGQADMWFPGAANYPHHQLKRLGSKKAFRLLPISKGVAEKVAKKLGLELMKIPAGIYAKDNGKNDAYYSPVTVVAFAVRTNMSNDLAYKVTKSLADHKEDFWKVNSQHKFYQPAQAWRNIGSAKLHPGAAKYYKEMGYMK